MDQEERIAVFLDYENLAIGARDHLGGMTFDLRPVADALAERGRVVVRRAYADWSYFDEDRRMLTRSHVELIDIPQKMGASRKNAADIKMVVDALELAFEREYISTFVLCTGDSDFTPLVHKLRELNKRVIGVGVERTTSALLPPACDEFLFYDRLDGVEVPPSRPRRSRPAAAAPVLVPAKAVEPVPAEPAPEPVVDAPARDLDTLATLVAQTVSGMQRSASGTVTASTLKRTLLRKDPTFNEADYGFRAFGEMLRHLAGTNVVELSDGQAKGDPEISLPEHGDREAAFGLLHNVVADLAAGNGAVALSGLKNQVRKVAPDFSEKKLGYRSFLQFAKAAATGGAIDLAWSADADDYLLTPPADE
ncbi:PIN domain-containing protein [Jidongwangia harbinensis]|uniref:PIN domain-containing protein n=1 Tax=Jidongwangia harbinensis TaxID=2878561 RepID=UPI001CD96095|nr:PIN domain-containing protein [Jidongwangia harbinensis]MCA2217181.1 NYN domain-containing protein [Jidongwangia harbinensis]